MRERGAESGSAGRIAEVLVVVMSEGMSLTEWDRAGLVGREWALWAHLRDRYGRVVVVSHDRAGGDVAIASRLAPRPEVVWNEAGATDEAYAATAPERVRAVVAGARAVVVRTNQFRGGRIAVGISRELREAGTRVGLVARGGYVGSRWAAWERGGDDATARRVAEEEALVCGAADVVIGPRVTVDDLAWRYGIGGDRIAVVENFVVADRPPVRAPARDAREVLVVGRAVRQKRVDVVIEAMALLPGLGVRDARLTVVGGGPEEAGVRDLAASRGVRAEFVARESHQQVIVRMERCGVFVQASAYEASPKTVVEAMATGAPVVVANAYGLGEMVEPEQTGVVAHGDAESMARALARVMRDDGLRERIGTGAAAWARRERGLARIAALECGAHERALARNGAHAPGRPAGSGEVRWGAEMPAAPTPESVAAWTRSVRAFASRMPAVERARFLMGLDAELYGMAGPAAIDAAGGVHPKHEHLRYHDFFVDRIGRGQRVLDLGCNAGEVSMDIAARCGAEVVGLEIVPEHVRAGRAAVVRRGLADRVDLREGDITRDRAPGVFDVVVVSNVLEHLRDRPALLARWAEWYGGAGGARFLVRVPAFDRDWRVPFKKDLGVEWRLDVTHETEYTVASLRAELEEAGLEVEELVANWGEYWVSARVREARSPRRVA
jgi:glycosyltransferase involved in cell wall biosynthesis/SAM-dependent methyltransferase